MKIWCDNCNGRGEISKKSITNSFYFDKCPDCKGKGYTNPSQQTLDDLECAEIKREILKQASRIDTYTLKDMSTQITLLFEINIEKTFISETEVKALRKAKEWIERRGWE